jgi:NAD(P)-dependent dehydrogenase (short-subunit alcohol dehydrogenase family)
MQDCASEEQPRQCRDTLILGGSGGLGRVVMAHFPGAVNWSNETGVNLIDFPSIDSAAGQLPMAVTRLINCAGANLLLPFSGLHLDALEELMQVNAFALVWVVRELRSQGLLAKGAAICNVVSNAAHIPMTHSLAYNASKAAAEMITRQMARELKDYCIFAVNPNKLAGTPMSREIEAAVCDMRGWTPEEAKRYQLAALPAGVETPPQALAAFIAELMRPVHHPFITGCVFPYGGPQG